MYCIECGAQILENSKFCYHCGKKQTEREPIIKFFRKIRQRLLINMLIILRSQINLFLQFLLQVQIQNKIVKNLLIPS